MTPKVKGVSGQKRWIFLFAWILFVYGSFIYFFRGNISWESVGETLFRIFLLFLIILVNIGLGKKVFKWVNFKISSFLEFFLFSFGIGLTIFTYIVIALGLTGLFNKLAMTLVLLWLFIFCYEEIEDVVHQTKVKLKSLISLKLSLLEIILFFILFIQVMFNLFGASVLPSSWDALAVHLAIPKEWGRLHHIVGIPYFRFGGFPIPYNIGVLYGASLLVKDAILAKLIHFALGIFALIGIYSLSRKYFSRRIALISVIVFYTIPIVSWNSTTAYVDLGFTFYAFLAFYAFINWVNSRKNGWLIILAIMSGMGIGSKITGFLCAGILFLGVIIGSLFLNKGKLVKVIKNVLLFSGLTGLFGSFWYLIYYNSGYSIFYYLKYLLKGSLRSSHSFTIAQVAALPNYVFHSISPYLSLPWNLTMHGLKFHGPGTIGLFFLAFLPFLIFPWFRKNKLIKFSLYYSIIYLIFWGVCAPYKRGLIPVFPLLSIMVAYIISKLLNFNKLFKAVLSFMIIFAFVFQMLYLAPEGLGRIYQRMLVFTGLKSQEEYILENEKTYRVFKYINERLPSNAKIFVINDPRTFYCDYPYVTRVPAVRNLFSKAGTEILKKFKEAEITHLLINKYYEDVGISHYLKVLDAIRMKHLRVVYHQYPFMVFKIIYGE